MHLLEVAEDPLYPLFGGLEVVSIDIFLSRGWRGPVAGGALGTVVVLSVDHGRDSAIYRDVT